jgi:hypothetical protein
MNSTEEIAPIINDLAPQEIRLAGMNIEVS